MTLSETFERIATEGMVPSLRRSSGTFEFDIAGGEHWFIKLDQGVPSLASQAEHADCTIRCGAGDFMEIAQGNRNLVTSYLRGSITCEGDLGFALDLRRLLPVTE